MTLWHHDAVMLRRKFLTRPDRAPPPGRHHGAIRHSLLQRGVTLPGADHGLDETPQAPHGAAAPLFGDNVALPPYQTGHPPGVEAALASDIDKDRRQERVEVIGARLRKRHDAESVKQGGRQRRQIVGGRDIADVREVEFGLKRGIRIVSRCFRLQEAQETVPEATVIAASSGLFQLIDNHKGICLPGARNGQKRV